MSILAHTVSDTATMLRRVLRHTTRNPATLIMSFALPLILLLLFNYAFGGAINTNGAPYLDYLVPGIVLMGVAYSTQTTALAVNTDVAEGIFDRFRTMAIARSAVLTGHVVGSTLRCLLGLTVVVAVALAIGFRPTANPVRWLAVLGMVSALLFALAWLATAFGLAAKDPTAASGLGAIVTLLPFLSGAFVPTDTMPGWLRVFTANQPMTHVVDTVRALLMDTAVGDHWWIAVAWCAAIAAVGFLWAQRLSAARAPR